MVGQNHNKYRGDETICRDRLSHSHGELNPRGWEHIYYNPQTDCFAVSKFFRVYLSIIIIIISRW